MTYDIILFTDLNSKFWHCKPLGAYRIASELRDKGYTVKVLDFAGEWFSSTYDLIKILSALIGDHTLFIGFSGTFFGYRNKDANPPLVTTKIRSLLDRISSPYPCNKEKFDHLCKMFKTKWPHVKLVYGGNRQYNMSLNDYFDYLVLGIADSTVVELASHLKFKTPLRFNFSGNRWKIIDHDVKGLSFNFPTSITRYEETDHVFPGEVLALETSRGCMFKCSFCSFPLLGRSKHDPAYKKEIDILSMEIKRNWDLYRINKYFIVDDTFNESTSKLEAVAEAINKVNIKIEFFAYLRIDLFEKFPEQIHLLKEMGLRSAFFGIETLNDQSAKAIGKGMPSSRIKELMYKCRQIWGDEVTIHTNYILGLPYEDPSTVENWMDWVINESPADSILVYPVEVFLDNNEKPLIHSDFMLNPSKYNYEKNGLHWKNDTWSYEIVKELANNINLKNQNSGRLKLGSWDLMGMMNYGYTYDELKNLSYKDLDKELLTSKYFDMFNQYKKKLFEFEKIPG